jgi:hypothetical protein
MSLGDQFLDRTGSTTVCHLNLLTAMGATRPCWRIAGVGGKRTRSNSVFVLLQDFHLIISG